MYECVQIGQNTFYMDCPSRVGIFRDGDRAWLVDSGSDESAAKKALGILADMGLKLEAAIVTHYHADHTGGAALLAQRTGCRLMICEPLAPAAFAQINAALLYGANPPKPLRGKFFLAKDASYEDAQRAALPDGMRLVRLDGHAFAMLGVYTPDGVWFVGDAVTPPRALEKYKITYLYDVEKYLQSLETASRLSGKLFVPAHAEPVESLEEMVACNRRWVFETARHLEQALCVPMTFEALLKRVFDEYGLEMTFGQHTLVGATVRAFLTWLLDQGRVSYFCEENRLLWKSAQQREE